MRLASIAYSELEETEDAWYLERFDLGAVNLLVGKNASGKSRTINIIKALADLVSGERAQQLFGGTFDAVFVNTQEAFQYTLHFKNSIVAHEELIRGGEKLLRRTQGDYGRIWTQEANKDMRFDIPAKSIAAVVKRD